MDANLRVLSRVDLISLLDSAMREPALYWNRRGKAGVEHSDTSVIKTFMVEAALTESSSRQPAKDLALNIFKDRGVLSSATLRIYESDDPELLTIEADTGRGDIVGYLDISNPRFWLLHSMSSSHALSGFMGGTFARETELDKAWMPSQLLDRLSGLGPLRGLGLAFDRRVLADVDFDSPDAPVEVLKMQLWGGSARQVLRALQEEETLPNATTLSKIRISVESDGSGTANIEDIKFDGKISARGSSFTTHLALVNHVVDLYSEKIGTIEAEYPLKSDLLNGTHFLRGEPINFLFTRPIVNLLAFCKALFSAREPFRLWGVPQRRAEGYYTVQAIDLHVGSNLRFEITPDFMRVYLPAEACGNTIIRLYTNLQHHYDAMVKAENGNGDNIFEF